MCPRVSRSPEERANESPRGVEDPERDGFRGLTDGELDLGALSEGVRTNPKLEPKRLGAVRKVLLNPGQASVGKSDRETRRVPARVEHLVQTVLRDDRAD